MTLNKDNHYEVIRDNNVAQTELADILENYSKEVDTLRINAPLHGDLNLSVLAEQGFGKIKHIVLGKGEITSVILPKGIETFECCDNLILKLETLPKSLIELNVSYNIIEGIDISYLTNLEKFTISHNKIKTIENLPKNIKEFVCDFNQIEFLNLENVTNLSKLHASNNSITLIENLPDSVSDLQLENNPSITYRNSNIDATTNRTPDDTDGERHRNYTDAINEYFKLKNKYETDFMDAKRKVYKNEPNKKRAKQITLRIKPKCIKCKRPVGTIFSKNEQRYEAICGDSLNPCSLDIQIYPGELIQFQTSFNWLKDDFDAVKDRIIRQKLDTLFNYISEEQSVASYTGLIKEYNEASNFYKVYLDKYYELYNNEQRDNIIQTKTENLFKLIEGSRIMIDEYKNTDNKELLHRAVDSQINQIIPEARNIRMLTHKIMEMVQTDESLVNPGRLPVYTLFQRPVSIAELDYESGEQQRVIKFKPLVI
mgnify:CR=1 FL=1